MKKLLATLLATTIMVSSAFAAAVDTTNNFKADTGKGETTFRITADTSATTLNVVVPMYVTYGVMADGTVVAPSNYEITNNGAFPVKLTGAKPTKIAGTYTLVADAAAANEFSAKYNTKAIVDATELIPAETPVEIAAGAKEPINLEGAKLGVNSTLPQSATEVFKIEYTFALK